MATIRQVEPPIPVYQCNECKGYFQVPGTCLVTVEYKEEVHYKIFETRTMQQWTCPNCGRENKKPEKGRYFCFP
ncbi:hypothetical protein QKT49_gp256 [Acanthamoeba castellanii medusavirus]|uniref:Uncharacterized protein n=1 Tax=Acanthamoeba castellanii medusavirus J1 TaxID=3114988 RepID=A0A3T1CXD3_9VIRU|nr:hypothetical protein QKT49_gp256 [Acanthamoeba castellanii medusavirus]BBI30507.1 hypothetical protein [Acanthamoeba castellanii medusavirus J1]